jgi:hypothetical protein
MIDCEEIAAGARFRLWFCLLFFLLLPQSGRCQQSQLDFATNYSFLRTNPAGGSGSFDSNGGSVSAAWHVRPWLGVAADFGGYSFGGQPQGVGGHLFTYTIGPRVSYRREGRSWAPFGQLLVGGARVSGTLNGQSASENGVALIVGGGADVRLTAQLAVRVLEVDYLMTRFTRVNDTPGVQNDLRVSAGVVLHFGRR